jgi:hypothetical protein
MRKVLILGVALLFPLLTVSSALGQNKKGKGRPVASDPAAPQDYQALAKLSNVQGQISGYDPVNKTMTIRVEYQVPDPNAKPPKNKVNPNYNSSRAYQQLQREYDQIMRIKNPIQRQNRLNQFAVKLQNQQNKDAAAYMKALQNQANVPTITKAMEFELTLASEVRVARKELELQYDDKGNVKTYTPEELKKLRDDVLPGYAAKMDDVMMGQKVYLFLAKTEKKRDPKAIAFASLALSLGSFSSAPLPSTDLSASALSSVAALNAPTSTTSKTAIALPTDDKNKDKPKDPDTAKTPDTPGTPGITGTTDDLATKRQGPIITGIIITADADLSSLPARKKPR